MVRGSNIKRYVSSTDVFYIVSSDKNRRIASAYNYVCTIRPPTEVANKQSQTQYSLYEIME